MLNQNLIIVANQLREAGNATIKAIIVLENEGEAFEDTVTELKLQAGDSFAAVAKIEQALFKP